MLRSSLYKKFGNGGNSKKPYSDFQIDMIDPSIPLKGYTTPNAPTGTVTLNNKSYAPGTFGEDLSVPTYTDAASPFNIFDVDLSTPQAELGPLSQEEVNQRQITSMPASDKKIFDINKYSDLASLGLVGANAILGRQQDLKNKQQFTQSIQQRGTKPVYDYNYMYGYTTSGGTEYQPTIKAEMGAKITPRTNTPYAANNVEIEGGEFIQLPNLEGELGVGPSHANGGINTILPANTRVFSDKLKPEGSKKTFAQISKKYDVTPYKKVLDNPFSKQVDKDTAQIMMDRNQKELDSLFKIQQGMNGNSNGQTKLAAGGEFDPNKPPIPAYTAEEIASLKKLDPNVNPSDLMVPGSQTNLGTGIYGEASNLDLFNKNWDWYLKDLKAQGVNFDPTQKGQVAQAQRAFNEEAYNRYIRRGLSPEEATKRVQQEGFVVDQDLQNSIDDKLGKYTALRVLPEDTALATSDIKPEYNALLDSEEETSTPQDQTTGPKFNPATGRGKGTYTPGSFDLYQVLPEATALGYSQDIYPYAIPEINAPFIRPQTMNIQSQIQDIDNMAQSAMKAGANPYDTYIAGLDAKSRAFQNKQNYDAQARAQADQANAQGRLNADQVNAGMFNQVYNDLVASARDAQTAEKQKQVASMVTKKANFQRDEAKKKAYIESLVKSFDVDSDGNIKLSPDQLTNFFYNPLPNEVLTTQANVNAAKSASKPTTKKTTKK